MMQHDRPPGHSRSNRTRKAFGSPCATRSKRAHANAQTPHIMIMKPISLDVVRSDRVFLMSDSVAETSATNSAVVAPTADDDCHHPVPQRHQQRTVPDAAGAGRRAPSSRHRSERRGRRRRCPSSNSSQTFMGAWAPTCRGRRTSSRAQSSSPPAARRRQPPPAPRSDHRSARAGPMEGSVDLSLLGLPDLLTPAPRRRRSRRRPRRSTRDAFVAARPAAARSAPVQGQRVPSRIPSPPGACASWPGSGSWSAGRRRPVSTQWPRPAKKRDWRRSPIMYARNQRARE